jgi:CO/xanthine dehydrogenase FAD-binding subunit
VAFRALQAEKELEGNILSDGLLDKVSRLVSNASHPISDINGMESYKHKIIELLVKDAVSLSYRRATGGMK